MTKALLFSIFTSMVFVVNAQDTEIRRLRLEVEPYSFFAQGVAGSILYTFDKKGLWSIGAYSASLNVPNRMHERIFQNVAKDSSSVRLGFQLSASLRYKIKVFCSYESNPYVGLMLGWQYFDVVQQPLPDPVRLSTFLITPNAGYEFYLFKRRLYINPQVRLVIYAGQSTDTPARPEKISGAFIFPQAIVGFKF